MYENSEKVKYIWNNYLKFLIQLLKNLHFRLKWEQELEKILEKNILKYLKYKKMNLNNGNKKSRICKVMNDKLWWIKFVFLIFKLFYIHIHFW